MQCPKCHTLLPALSLFCPQCGKRLNGSSFLRFWLVGGAIFLLLLAAWFAFTPSDNPEEPIQAQLEALKSQQVTEGYFKFTSQDFQQLTPLDKFKEFVATYPILIHHQNHLFGNVIHEKDKAIVTLYLSSKGENEAELHYELLKENRTWKIDSIKLVEYRKEVKEEPVNPTAAMIAPIVTQLKALKNQNLVGAYKNLVSKQFLQQTPFEAFKAFLVAHPLLKEYEDYDFKEHTLADNRGIATVVLHGQDELTPVEYRMIHEEGEWKILMMRIEAQHENHPANEEKSQDPAAMIDLVRDQLALLQQGKIRQVYDQDIAKETQAEISFENFQSFIQKYPALIKHNSVNIREPTLEKGLGGLVAELVDEQGTTVVEYHLAISDGSWKIIGMHISSTPEEPNSENYVEATPSSYKVRDLVAAIEAFLSALRSHDTVKAYELTSKEFQYANSQADFDQFFTKHPEFAASKASSFEKEMFNNAIATFSGQLILSETEVMPVEFDLVQEEGKWKILHLYALPLENLPKKAEGASTGTPATPLQFAELQLGTKVDDDGHILNPTTVFKADAGDLYVRLKVLNGVVGTEITLVLRHIDSGSALKPVSATLADNGNDTLTFLFSPPPLGWPKGSYQLRASSSSHVYKTFTFTVE